MNPTPFPGARPAPKPAAIAIAAAACLVLGVDAAAQTPTAPRPALNFDREVIVDSKKLSAEVNGAYGKVAKLLEESQLPALAEKLRGLAEADKPTSTDDVMSVLGAMAGEYDRLTQGLGPATTALETAETAVADAVGRLQSHLAKRCGDGKAGADAKVLANHDAHLRSLAERIQRSRDPVEKRNLEAVFDSAYVLRGVVEKAHGKMSESERRALQRVIEFLLRLQTDLAVATTRTRTLAVSVGHERELLGHFGEVLKVVSDSQSLIAVLNDLSAVGSDFIGGLDGQFGREILPLLEHFLDDAGRGVDEASGKLLDKSVARGHTTLSDADRQEAMRKLGVSPPATPANPKGGE